MFDFEFVSDFEQHLFFTNDGTDNKLYSFNSDYKANFAGLTKAETLFTTFGTPYVTHTLTGSDAGSRLYTAISSVTVNEGVTPSLDHSWTPVYDNLNLPAVPTLSDQTQAAPAVLT